MSLLVSVQFQLALYLIREQQRRPHYVLKAQVVLLKVVFYMKLEFLHAVEVLKFGEVRVEFNFICQTLRF